MNLGSADLRAILDELSPERRRLFACDCADHVLPMFTRCYPDDQRPHSAIQVARAFAEGRASVAELAAAEIAAETAARESGIDESCLEDAAPMVADSAAACCLADINEAVAYAVENAIWAVIIAVVGGESIDTIWQNNKHELEAATVERYRRAEAVERRWQHFRALQYRPDD